MNTRGSATFPVLTLKQIKLPVEVILLLAKFLCFEDFYKFVRALWPNRNECDAIRAALWRLSEHCFTTTFINGKELGIRYNFNPYRNIERRILLDRDSLLPIFGGIVLSTMNEFASMSELHNFVRMHVHLNKCSDYRYASCLCHLPYYDSRRRNSMMNHFTTENSCRYGHFHHYCSEHVLYWLNFYLATTIGLRENGTYEQHAEFAENFLVFLDDGLHFHGEGVPLHDPRH
ncbi:repeat element protein-b12.1 [Ichnoviriform fugitivi]|uniref:Repeat element protein-b12.1 n=1 Tax=Ichnoviriform fugitivi TaxID=265522 RepID=A2Q0E5_9VIRU|nr:repeat element protein-b12.1 [Ichnoviriform fugitivi]BAF45660.1 repeat element protein-b12.1 [Ichnoviriform fugitivi]